MLGRRIFLDDPSVVRNRFCEPTLYYIKFIYIAQAIDYCYRGCRLGPVRRLVFPRLYDDIITSCASYLFAHL